MLRMGHCKSIATQQTVSSISFVAAVNYQQPRIATVPSPLKTMVTVMFKKVHVLFFLRTTI